MSRRSSDGCRRTSVTSPMSAESSGLAARITELETRLAFQDQTVQTLNEVVTRQQRDLDRVQHEIETLKARLRGLEPSPVGRREDEPPPPHY